jgi:hypothetical protein
MKGTHTHTHVQSGTALEAQWILQVTHETHTHIHAHTHTRYLTTYMTIRKIWSILLLMQPLSCIPQRNWQRDSAQLWRARALPGHWLRMLILSCKYREDRTCMHDMLLLESWKTLLLWAERSFMHMCYKFCIFSKIGTTAIIALLISLWISIWNVSGHKV